MCIKMKTLFWNVDTQYDFMRDDESHRGALAVPDARSIEGNLAKLTDFARDNGYHIINTADWHIPSDPEISERPNLQTTYPMHCERNTRGAEFVPATRPINPYIINCRGGAYGVKEMEEEREIVVYKNEFDAFTGNTLTKTLVDIKNPDRVIVYGVALNVCDDYAVMGNVREGREVYAVLDAMKDLPHLAGTPLDTERVLNKWKASGVKFVNTKDVLEDRL